MRFVALVALALVSEGSAFGCSSAEFDVPAVGVDGFSIAVLPDTQGYTNALPEVFALQTEWLAENAEHHNIRAVVHVGDLVEGSWLPEQWEIADAAMSTLAEIPYLIAPGNHDYGALYEQRNSRTRDTLLHQYFTRSRFESMPTFGGFYPESDRVDSSFHTFRTGDQDWLILALEFAPRDAVLDWADDIIASHPGHLVVITTHAYLYWDNTRYDWAAFGDEQDHSPKNYGIASSEEGANDGQEIWDRIIADNDNVLAVLSGHTLGDGVGYAMSEGVHEVLANYQSRDNFGAGYLRLMQVDPTAQTIKVFTLSPWLKRVDESADEQFEIRY